MDITRDVMRMYQAGTALARIRGDVDAKYGRFGPATPTPRPK